MSYKQRRRRTARRSSARVAGVLVVAASLMMNSSSAYGEDAQSTIALQDNNDEQLRMPHDNSNGGGGHDHAIEYEDETSSSNFHRRLQLSAAQTFASFTPEDIAHAIPLDLMIDEGSGHAYIQGRAGYLASYAHTFAQDGVDGGGSNGDGGDGPTYWDSDNALHVDNIIQEGNSNNGDNNLHVESMHRIPPPRRPDRLYYNKDGADDNSNSGHSRGLRGVSRNKDGGGGPNVVHLVDITFGDFEEEGDESESFPEGGDINEEGEEEDDDDEVDFTISHEQEGRSLERFSHSGFVSSRGPHKEDDTQDSINQHQMTPHRNKKQDNNNKNKIGTSQTRKKVPTITKIRPRPGVAVGNAHSFVAKVLRSRSTKSPLKTVSFQLQNIQGSKSDPIDMTDIGDDTFEVTIDGFDRHKGTTWCFQISAKDVRGKKRNSDCIPFTVEGVGGSSNSFIVDDGDDDQDGIEKAPPTPEAKLMTQKEVSESDWNAGGEIKRSTVRILFKFKKSGDQVFVCSGAVVRDGSRGETSDMNDGRTIIVTAGHCVYSDLYKEFASEALVIPDQSSTRGSKSDFDCKNDNLGCWVASWGTVAKDWTKGTFPMNVPVSAQNLLLLIMQYSTFPNFTLLLPYV